MKNLILILGILLSCSILVSANNIEKGKIKILDKSEIVVSVNSDFDLSFITTSKYNTDAKNLEFQFATEVKTIHVFNEDGELEMILPINSKDLSLGMSLFSQGSYKIGFVVDNDDEIKYTDLLVR